MSMALKNTPVCDVKVHTPVCGVKNEASEREALIAERSVPSGEIRREVATSIPYTGRQNDLFRSKTPGLHDVPQRETGHS